MSRQIFRDIEESISREVRRITFHDDRTASRKVLKETFNPFTGEIVELPVEAEFYDSSADAHNIQYPHFFVKLLKTREDRSTGRIVSQYGKYCLTPVTTSPRAYEIVLSDADGLIPSAGNNLETTTFRINKIQPGHLIRLISGNNIGTYTVDSITPSATVPHTITVSSTIVDSMPAGLFESTSRVLTFTDPIDLNTVLVGDTFEDASAGTFSITAITIASGSASITLGGVATPDLTSGSKITRSGNIFTNVDASPVKFLILDPTKPIQAVGIDGVSDVYTTTQGTSPEIPLDVYYMVRIDSKERDTHIDVLNRMWEEFNPPRTALPVIVRSSLSFEQQLQVDIAGGGSNTLDVGDNSGYNLNEEVFIFNDLTPTKDNCGKFPEPFKSKVVGKVSTNEIVLEDTVPDTFTVSDNTKIVSNATFRTYMFHFVEHLTRDIEGAQYWVHEFTFWIQIYIDRLEEPEVRNAIQNIGISAEDIEGNVIIEC